MPHVHVDRLEPRSLCAGDFGFATEAVDNVRAADTEGNVYTSIDRGVLTKRDAGGDVLWQRMIEGDVFITGVATDADSNVYFTGNFSGRIDFDPGPAQKVLRTGGRVTHHVNDLPLWPNGRPEDDIFVAKLDARGKLVWARSVPSSGRDETGTDIRIDPSGDVIIAGTFSGTADFRPGKGEKLITADGRPNDRGVPRDAFLWKLDGDGKFEWVRQFNVFEPISKFSWDPQGFGLDAAGNVFMSGSFSGHPDFDPGPGKLHLQSSTSRQDGGDSYLLKLDPRGRLVWAGQVDALVSKLAVAPDGHSYIMGIISAPRDVDPGPARVIADPAAGSDYIARVSPDGNLLWFRQNNATVMDAATDAVGNLFMTGEFDDTTDFDLGPATRTISRYRGFGDAFVWKITPDAQLGWVRTTGSPWRDVGYSIAVSPTGGVFTNGYFSGRADFDPGKPRTVLVNDIFGGGYLWKLMD